MSYKSVQHLVLGATLAMACHTAFAASTISTTYLGSAYGYSSANISPNPSSSGVSVGAFKMHNNTANNYEFVDKSTANSTVDEFIAWCVDPTHWLQTNATYNIGGATELNSAFGATRTSNLQALANQRYSLVDTKDESAAFQLATWTILFGSDGADADTFLDFSNTSTFKAWNLNSAVSSLATSWLNTLGSAQATGNYKVHYLYDQLGRTGSNQDLVTFTVNPVPLPAAAWLFGSALLGFMGWSRRRYSAV